MLSHSYFREFVVVNTDRSPFTTASFHVGSGRSDEVICPPSSQNCDSACDGDAAVKIIIFAGFPGYVRLTAAIFQRLPCVYIHRFQSTTFTFLYKRIFGR